MPRAELMHVDMRAGPRHLAGSAGMIEVNVRHQRVANVSDREPESRKALDERGHRAGGARFNQHRPQVTTCIKHHKRGERLRDAEVMQIDGVDRVHAGKGES